MRKPPYGRARGVPAGALLALLLSAGVLESLAGARSPRGQATFRSRAEAVRVSVLVTDGESRVAGLQASDFELLDNGVPQRVDLATAEDLPIELVLALDVSESVRGERMTRLIEACNAMLDGLMPGDQATLLTFNHGLSRRGGPTTNLAELRQKLAGLEGGGSTALRDAVQAALLTAGTGAGLPLVVVFSDGEDLASWLTDEEVLATARASDVPLYAVRIGRGTAPFLPDAADATGGRLFAVNSDSDLRARFVAVLDEFKGRYILGFRPSGPASPGWHELEVRVRNRRASVKARPGYYR